MSKRGARRAQPAPSDGRSTRAIRLREETKAKIVDALRRLIKQGLVDPTIAQVAETSGLSRSVIFKHFDNKDSLRAALAQTLEASWSSMIAEPDFATDALDRIERLVVAQTGLVEMMTPFRRSALLDEPFSEKMKESLERGRQAIRRSLAGTLAPELKNLSPSAQKALLDILHTLICWESWERLRTNFGCSVSDAKTLIVWTARNVLKAALNGPGLPPLES